jgi:NTE family protein
LVAPGVAWVLGSGGPRGLAHVGVLKALLSLGLRPSMVVGSSVGALVGVLYAAGLSVAQIETLALEIGLFDVVRPHLRGPGWISAAGVVGWVSGAVRTPLLEQLPLPFFPVAMHLSTRQPIAFTRGHVGAALHAACAIEGQFAPVMIQGQRYVDADLAVPLPVRLARRLGAQRVLAIDVSAHEDKAPKGTEDWREADLRKRALTAPDVQQADVLLHPDIGYYAGMRRAWREMAIRVAEADTLRHATALRTLHGVSI